MEFSLKKGQTFESFQSFHVMWKKYCEENHVLTHICSSKSVQQYNKELDRSRLKSKKQTPVLHVDEEWHYSYINYRCVHSGEVRQRGQGNRPHQR